MSTLNLSETEHIDVRASRQVKLLLQEAAQACQQNLSDFLLEAGINAATQSLTARRQFALDEVQYEAFQRVLDRPVKHKPRLEKLLRAPGVLG